MSLILQEQELPYQIEENKKLRVWLKKLNRI